MSYKWKPSALQKREFANNMKNEEFVNEYYAKREAKVDKRRSTSQFDYNAAGGNYVPTREQYIFCVDNINQFETREEIDAMNFVMSGYVMNEKVHHDYIHIVNEKRRKINHKTLDKPF
jgi:hypothetical protein